VTDWRRSRPASWLRRESMLLIVSSSHCRCRTSARSEGIERRRRKMAQRRLVWKIEPFQSAWRAEALEGRAKLE
jgi:hypothetical protein